MIVTARAADREPEERLPHGVRLLVREIHRELPRIRFVQRLRAHGEETRGDEQLRALACVRSSAANDLPTMRNE